MVKRREATWNETIESPESTDQATRVPMDNSTGHLPKLTAFVMTATQGVKYFLMGDSETWLKHHGSSLVSWVLDVTWKKWSLLLQLFTRQFRSKMLLRSHTYCALPQVGWISVWSSAAHHKTISSSHSYPVMPAKPRCSHEMERCMKGAWWRPSAMQTSTEVFTSEHM